METVGIRALKQNASQVVAAAARGESVTITDRGRPMARLTPLAPSRLSELVASGAARPARRPIKALSAPEPGPDLSAALAVMRAEERF